SQPACAPPTRLPLRAINQRERYWGRNITQSSNRQGEPRGRLPLLCHLSVAVAGDEVRQTGAFTFARLFTTGTVAALAAVAARATITVTAATTAAASTVAATAA